MDHIASLPYTLYSIVVPLQWFGSTFESRSQNTQSSLLTSVLTLWTILWNKSPRGHHPRLGWVFNPIRIQSGPCEISGQFVVYMYICIPKLFHQDFSEFNDEFCIQLPGKQFQTRPIINSKTYKGCSEHHVWSKSAIIVSCLTPANWINQFVRLPIASAAGYKILASLFDKNQRSMYHEG